VAGATEVIGKLLTGPDRLALMAPSCLGITAKDSTYHMHFRVTPQTGVGSYCSLRTNRERTGHACSAKENRSVDKLLDQAELCRQRRQLA
jgi:hypothetical protein